MSPSGSLVDVMQFREIRCTEQGEKILAAVLIAVSGAYWRKLWSPGFGSVHLEVVGLK